MRLIKWQCRDVLQADHVWVFCYVKCMMIKCNSDIKRKLYLTQDASITRFYVKCSHYLEMFTQCLIYVPNYNREQSNLTFVFSNDLKEFSKIRNSDMVQKSVSPSEG